MQRTPYRTVNIWHKGEGSYTYYIGKQAYEHHYTPHYYGNYHEAAPTTRPRLTHAVARLRRRRAGQLDPLPMTGITCQS